MRHGQTTEIAYKVAFKPVTVEQPKAIEQPIRVANNPNSTELKTVNKVANKHGKYSDKEGRKAYMREYMAKRRATTQNMQGNP